MKKKSMSLDDYRNIVLTDFREAELSYKYSIEIIEKLNIPDHHRAYKLFLFPLVITYMKPFMDSYFSIENEEEYQENTSFRTKLKFPYPKGTEEYNFHIEICNLRNKIIAHNDLAIGFSSGRKILDDPEIIKMDGLPNLHTEYFTIYNKAALCRQQLDKINDHITKIHNLFSSKEFESVEKVTEKCIKFEVKLKK